MKDLRTSLLALAIWAVALLLVHLPAWSGALATGCALAAVALTAWRRGPGLVVLMLLCAAAVAVSIVAAQPARDVVATNDGRAVETLAEVTSSASAGADGRLWFDAQTVLVGAPGRPDTVSAPVRIGVDPVEGVELGARVRVTGQAKRTDAGERAALVVFGAAVKVESPASGVFAIAARTRAEFVARAGRLPEPGAALLPGLAVGDTRAVSEELDEAMRASGLSHLTAVSGSNCMLIVAGAFGIVTLCGGGRALRVWIALGALAAFVVLVTPEPSVIRAAVMAALAMISVLLGRPSAGLAMLSLAMCGILIADPWLSASPGFALSAAATAALLVLSRPLLHGLGRWMPVPLALALAVPLAAQVVCGPIIALFSETQSLIGVPANLLAAPAAPIATVVGLLACLTSVLPPIADLFAAAAWLPSAWIEMTAVTAAGLPGATMAVVPGPVAALAVAVLSAAITLLIVRTRLRRVRTASAAVVVIALGLAGARILITGPLAPMTTPEEWSIAMCDVGQGDAVLVRSAGRTALIDAGPDPEALRACLSATGTARIDLLVLTHFDLDHVGGAAALTGMVDTVLHGPVASPDDERVLQALAAGGGHATTGAAGVHGSLGDADWRVLWPPADSAAFPSGNDASVVLEIGGGDVPRSLMLGDLSAGAQRQLLAGRRVDGPYAVVKVAHHGSRDQDPGLYAAAAPTVALIGVGAENDYGHPRDEALAMLGGLGARTLRTDERGLILLGARGDEIVIWAGKDDMQ